MEPSDDQSASSSESERKRNGERKMYLFLRLLNPPVFVLKCILLDVIVELAVVVASRMGT